MSLSTESSDIPIKPGLFVDDDFHPDRARLRGSRCTHCNEAFFPPRGVCPRCQTTGTMAEVTLGRTGRISAITAVERPPHHYPQPYWLAEIDLPEGVRVLTQVDAPLNPVIAVGTVVTLTTRPLLSLPDGKRVWGYVFSPARQPGTAS